MRALCRQLAEYLISWADERGKGSVVRGTSYTRARGGGGRESIILLEGAEASGRSSFW
jgi:hypothetical protein